MISIYRLAFQWFLLLAITAVYAFRLVLAVNKLLLSVVKQSCRNLIDLNLKMLAFFAINVEGFIDGATTLTDKAWDLATDTTMFLLDEVAILIEAD